MTARIHATLENSIWGHFQKALSCNALITSAAAFYCFLFVCCLELAEQALVCLSSSYLLVKIIVSGGEVRAITGR